MKKVLSGVLVILFVVSCISMTYADTKKTSRTAVRKKTITSTSKAKTSVKKSSTSSSKTKTSTSTKLKTYSKKPITGLQSQKPGTKKTTGSSSKARTNTQKAVKSISKSKPKSGKTVKKSSSFKLWMGSKRMKSLNIDSKSAILIDMNSGKIIYAKNIHDKHYPASTTKILTSILALEKGSFKGTVKVGVGPTLAEPSKIYLKNGERIKLMDLLYATLLPSANDAAAAIAENIGGSVTGFADLMNKKAKAIGCVDSHFVTPNGLFNINHYTSAYDMALIARYAMQNSTFRRMVSTINYRISATNKSPARSLINHNKMLYDKKYYYRGCIGVKTGYTSQSHHTLVSAAKRGNTTLLAVILDDQVPPYHDITTMFNYGFSLKK